MSMNKIHVCISCISGGVIGNLVSHERYLASFGVAVILLLSLCQTETIRKLKEQIKNSNFH